MKSLPTAAGLVLVCLLLTGCAAAARPASTVTVTVTPSPTTPTLQAGDAAPWDLHAVCAAEAGTSTLEQWSRYQQDAGRLSRAQEDAVLQGIAVQYLEMHQFSAPSSVQEAVDALARASGTLDRPRIDLDSSTVRRARTTLAKVCSDSGLTIGVIAQGG